MNALKRRAAHPAELAFALAVLVVAGALAACFAAWNAATGADGTRACAVVSRDGTPIQTIDLTNVSEPSTLLLEDARGNNLVEVDRGRIRVTEADCPDKICAQTGWIERPGQVIACVPHGLTITVEREGEEAFDGPDAVAG